MKIYTFFLVFLSFNIDSNVLHSEVFLSKHFFIVNIINISVVVDHVNVP